MGVIRTCKLRTCSGSMEQMNKIKITCVVSPSCICSSMVERIVEWCCEELEFSGVTIHVSLRDSYKDCWGFCEQESKKVYRISICTDQSLRDFTATVCHEMIHVNQWITGVWEGDGEEECKEGQYEMADAYWDSC